MRTLSKNAIERYYFVANDVVFDIRSTNPNEDTCAVLGAGVTWNEDKDDEGNVTGHTPDETTANVPYITVLDNEVPESADTMEKLSFYYLDSLVERGDSYVCGKLESLTCEFKKRIHTTDGSEETLITLDEYYEELVDEAMLNLVKRYFEKDYDWFSKNLEQLGIPGYMIAGSQYSVTGITPFEFTEEVLTDMKNEVVKNEVLYAAKDTAKAFNYELDEDFEACVEDSLFPIKEEAEPVPADDEEEHINP